MLLRILDETVYIPSISKVRILDKNTYTPITCLTQKYIIKKEKTLENNLAKIN